MDYSASSLITTIVGGLTLAYLFGMIAQRLRVSPLIGYLLAGVIIGPFTPGFVANTNLASELAEIGVILLMFGVGLHFSLKDLLSVKSVAIPGAIAQIITATLLGLALAMIFGWGLFAGTVFGLCLSTASTVVLLRALEERQLIYSKRGKIAIGWLIVEDLVMVLTLVLLPCISDIVDSNNSSFNDLIIKLIFTVSKVIIFIIITLLIGRKLIPWMLARTAATGSRELFTLAVLVLALGIAYTAVTLFNASFALGAFFAGMILNESELSHRAAQDTLPLRDAFAVLFFVSVGMIFNPIILIEFPIAILAVLAIITIGKSLAALILMRLFGHSHCNALTIAISLAQIGEFSFILSGIGFTLHVFDNKALNLVIAGAIISIMINPLLFSLLDRYLKKTETVDEELLEESQEEIKVIQIPVDICGHAIIVGYGRVGTILAKKLRQKNIPLVIIENTRARFEELSRNGFRSLIGNAVSKTLMRLARIDCAQTLLLTIPNGYEAGQIVEKARLLNPDLTIIVRAHYDDEIRYISERGANHIVVCEHEIAKTMAHFLTDN
ncbi:Inner membrane protein YbaL [Candidatus Arsenophonus lipoptenae]|uniref:Inner membrane protein YbaL n=1 Tax=Candidatus Arsenophonus lipoptenae TaxID=634113 RepID=A0A0X9WAM9_9GAMM|nr:YbaL family putative K(+) efflux transporter [Candidatus Arsenophonus lipoptenae]AMA64943.1 Inner membrane protein YbaL [Candidatus Arsenophonus lipoptenae]